MNKLYGMLLGAVMLAAACPPGDVGAAVNPPKPAVSEPQRPATVLKPGASGSYLSGQFARARGDIASAIHYLEKTHRQNPENEEVAGQLQGLLLLEGRIDEAIAVAERSQRLKADPVTILLFTVRELKRGDMEAAAEALDAAFETDGGQLWLPLVEAWLNVGRDRLKEPVTVESLAAGRDSPIVHYHLALINAQAGFTDAAALNLRHAVSDKDNPPPPRIMAALLQFYDIHESEILKALAETFRSRGGYDMADDAPSIAVPQDGVAEVLFTMGSVMRGAGVTQDAVVYLNLALYLRPKLTVARLTLGDAYSDLHQFDKAAKAYAAIPAASGSYLRAQLRMAINANQAGSLPNALSLLDREIKRAPSPEAFIVKADLLRTHGRCAEAADSYTQALAHIAEPDGRHWPVLYARGGCYERLGKWQQAETDLLQALKLQPEQPDVLNYLGYSWLVRGERIDEAHGMIAKAVKVRPNDAQIVDSMGWALYLLGRYGDAAGYLERAVELMPADPTVNDHLGDAYWRMGRKVEARYQWERSLSFSPEPSLAEVIERKLREGLPPARLIQDASAPGTAHAMTRESSNNATVAE